MVGASLAFTEPARRPSNTTIITFRVLAAVGASCLAKKAGAAGHTVAASASASKIFFIAFLGQKTSLPASQDSRVTALRAPGPAGSRPMFERGHCPANPSSARSLRRKRLQRRRFSRRDLLLGRIGHHGGRDVRAADRDQINHLLLAEKFARLF